MSGITGLAEMGSFIIESIDDFHFKAVFVDSHIASKIWTLCDATRDVMYAINEILISDYEKEEME
jgi:hypothetical protein